MCLSRLVGVVLASAALAACDGPRVWTEPLVAQAALSDAQFAALVERISEPGGYFDTDNLISNESGYLKVVDALGRIDLAGTAYVGVGPDQNFSYIAAVHPSIAFIVDIRRDNLLQHLLLKALIERSATRVEFLAALHGRRAPVDPDAWRGRDVARIVAYVDSLPPDSSVVEALEDEIDAAVDAWGIPLSEDDHATIRRFHRAFVDAGPSLRFTSFGRPPRPYYPTYRQLLLETDIDGERASYLADPTAYRTVRSLELANRIVPVVGDLAGPHALREMAQVMREMDVELGAFYVSNVEFYLWQGGTFADWIENLSSFPAVDEAVTIRSYFPGVGPTHPSSVPGYYSTQILQPVATLAAGSFASYWEVVTRGILDLR